MKALILAAGRGSRMGVLTKEQPKCLTVVNGKTLLQHQFDALTQSGIQDIAIITGYKFECFRKYEVQQFHNSRWAETNMVASLLCAKEWLEQNDVIVSYSDIFYDSQIVNDLIACSDDIAIAYDPNWLKLWSKRFQNPLDDAETFRIDNVGYLLEIGQKPSSIEVIQGQYMGLLKFKKDFWHSYKNEDINLDKIDMTSFLNSLILDNYKIKTCPNFENWGECDSASDVVCYRSCAQNFPISI